MTRWEPRLRSVASSLPEVVICDAWQADGSRVGDEHVELGEGRVLGHWPDGLDIDAAVRLAEATGPDADWAVMEETPPVAQKLSEAARLQPLDVEIVRHLPHLQHVCQRPRLHLRVEEERLLVSRARRTPVRAVAELVSHPADWEHRTLRSIQPSRVLARESEDEWNLYENRVAVRLVDHLLAYLARRLEELRRIAEIVAASREHGAEVQRTSHWRARRIATLWAQTLDAVPEQELRRTAERLELAQRELQALLDAPLYRRIPRRQHVAIGLMPTNILVNDLHYRKVAALWRAWVTHGHRQQETQEQRRQRRQREGTAWDRFVLHLVVRAFKGWTAEALGARRWQLHGGRGETVHVTQAPCGTVEIAATTGERLELTPLCADVSGADGALLERVIAASDARDVEVVAVHVGEAAACADIDRATGWRFGTSAVLFAASPWGIDMEERMARLINGWLQRRAGRPYPLAVKIHALPPPPADWEWVRYRDGWLVAWRAPDGRETDTARTWVAARTRELERSALQAKQAKQAFATAPANAVQRLGALIDESRSALGDLDRCPVCDGHAVVRPRPGKRDDGGDATWWADCGECQSHWGLRACKPCGHRYRALALDHSPGLAAAVRSTPPSEWPDKLLGRDTWAQPCASGPDHFRCPSCGRCSRGECTRARGVAEERDSERVSPLVESGHGPLSQ